MNAAGHTFMGLALAYGVHYAAPYLPAPAPALGAALGLAVFGALLPDIDHPHAKASRMAGIHHGSGPLGVFGWLGGIFRAALGGHRGLTHTALAAALIGWALWTFIPLEWRPYAQAFWLGWVSHILADMLTEAGVPLFWPLSGRRVGLWR